MTTYYKATFTDGRDFRTGTVDYAGHLESGEPLPEIVSISPRCCTDTVYHASVSKADTLIGGSWPCRLFEVTGTPVAAESTKRGFSTLRVSRELRAWEALGPNGEAVAALIDRAGRLTVLETHDLGEAHETAVDGLDKAWRAAWYAALGTGRGAAQEAARYGAFDAVRGAVGSISLRAAGYDVWRIAQEAARRAAHALVVRDILSKPRFDTLYGPWGSVIG